MGDAVNMTCDVCDGVGYRVSVLDGRVAYCECATCAGAGYVLVRLRRAEVQVG